MKAPALGTAPLHAVVSALVQRVYEQQTQLSAATTRQEELRTTIGRMSTQLNQLRGAAKDAKAERAALTTLVAGQSTAIHAAQASAETAMLSMQRGDSERATLRSDFAAATSAASAQRARAGAAEESIAATRATLQRVEAEIERRATSDDLSNALSSVRALEGGLAAAETRAAQRSAAHAAALEARFKLEAQAVEVRREGVAREIAAVNGRLCALDTAKASKSALREEATALHDQFLESSRREAELMRAAVAADGAASRAAHATGTAQNAALLEKLREMVKQNRVVHSTKARANAVHVKAMGKRVTHFEERVVELADYVGNKLGQDDLIALRREMATEVKKSQAQAAAAIIDSASKVGKVVERCESVVFNHGKRMQRDAEANGAAADTLRDAIDEVDLRIDLVWKQLGGIMGNGGGSGGGNGGGSGGGDGKTVVVEWGGGGGGMSKKQAEAIEAAVKSVRAAKADKSAVERMAVRIDSLFEGMHQLEGFVVETQRAMRGAPNRAPMVSYGKIDTGSSPTARRAARAAIDTGSSLQGRVVRTIRPIAASARSAAEAAEWRAEKVVERGLGGVVSTTALTDSEESSPARLRRKATVDAARRVELDDAAWQAAKAKRSATLRADRPESELHAVTRVQKSATLQKRTLLQSAHERTSFEPPASWHSSSTPPSTSSPGSTSPAKTRAAPLGSPFSGVEVTRAAVPPSVEPFGETAYGTTFAHHSADTKAAEGE